MVLLERALYLSILEDALTETLAGTGQVVLVRGEAGIGKTALVQAFTRQKENQVRVLWGICDPLFTPRPLGPLFDIAAQLQGQLFGLLNSNAESLTIFSHFLIDLQHSPAIVVFEDVHWADEASLDLLRYIGRRITRTQSLLLLTYREDELGPQHQLRAVLGSLASSSAVHHILLPPLTEQAVSTLVGDRDIDVTALHRQTGGNPFYVTEVLGSSVTGIPPTIRDAILARAARLSPVARNVLEVAAVIGPRIEPWLLAEITRAEMRAAEECMSVGVLVAQGEVLTFRHELARQTILEMISPFRKQMLHRSALDSLRALPSFYSTPEQLAYHAEGAGDREAVLVYAPIAAQKAAWAGAHREAARLYNLALRYSEGLRFQDHALLFEAYSTECDHIGQQSEGIAARREALKLWRQLGNGLKEGENLAYLMNMLTRIGQNTEAQRVSRAATEILEALPPGRELAMAYRVQAAACLVNRDCQDALAWAERALELAQRLQDAEVLAAVHLTIGTTWLFLDYERGRQYLESKIVVFQENGLDARAAHAYSNLGSGSGELHQFCYADHYLSVGVAYAAERDLDSHRLYMQAWQALVSLYLGRWQEAELIARRVLEGHGVATISRITALVAQGRLMVRQGNAGAQAALDEALELALRAGNLQRLGPVRSARAEAAWLAGDDRMALAEVQSVYNLSVSKRHPWFTGELAFWRWRVGESVEAPDWLARPFALQIAGNWQAAADEWERLNCPYEQARALADGDPNAQTQALEIYERLGAWAAADKLRLALRSSGMMQLPRKTRSSTRDNPFGLTDRQVEILTLLLEGQSNAGIAARLHISLKTVDHHVSAVLNGLNVHTREAAAALARQHPHFKK